MFSVRNVSYDEVACAYKIKHLNDCKIIYEIKNLLRCMEFCHSREWRNGMRADRFQVFLYWFGVIPVFSLKYLQKNDVLGKLSVSLI